MNLLVRCRQPTSKAEHTCYPNLSFVWSEEVSTATPSENPFTHFSVLIEFKTELNGKVEKIASQLVDMCCASNASLKADQDDLMRKHMEYILSIESRATGMQPTTLEERTLRFGSATPGQPKGTCDSRALSIVFLLCSVSAFRCSLWLKRQDG